MEGSIRSTFFIRCNISRLVFALESIASTTSLLTINEAPIGITHRDITTPNTVPICVFASNIAQSLHAGSDPSKCGSEQYCQAVQPL